MKKYNKETNKDLAEKYAAGDQALYPEVLRISLSEDMTVPEWVRWYTGKSLIHGRKGKIYR